MSFGGSAFGGAAYAGSAGSVNPVASGYWGGLTGLATIPTIAAVPTGAWGALVGTATVFTSDPPRASASWGGLVGVVNAADVAARNFDFFPPPPLTNPTWDDLLAAPTARVIRRVDIYEADGVTPFRLDVPLIDGSVSVDYTRDERRTMDITIDALHPDDPSQDIEIGVTELWYDKIIKIYRGLFLEGQPEDAFVVQIGTFLIDQTESPHFPWQIHITGRDFTKKLLKDKFGVATTFTATTLVEDAIRGVIVAAGITQYNIPVTGKTLDVDFAYEHGVERWKAVKDMATAFGYEVFFNPQGIFTMQLFTDPLTAPLAYSFTTGTSGNLATYTKMANDSLIVNDLVVLGQTNLRVPVFGRAENNDPSSPTRIEGNLGRRSDTYESALVTTNEQAQALADTMLKIVALESFQIDMEALVIPWLEVGTAVEFAPQAQAKPDRWHVNWVPPRPPAPPAPPSPTRFLMTSFEIPLKLGPMSATARRITIVGPGNSLSASASGDWGILSGFATATGGTATTVTANGAWGGLTGALTATVTHIGGAAANGAWGALAATTTAVVTNGAPAAFGAWGGLTGTTTATGGSIHAIVSGIWGMLLGTATATGTTVQAVASRNWGILSATVTATSILKQAVASRNWGSLVGTAAATGGSGGGGSITHGRQINASNTGFTAFFDGTLGRNLVVGDLTPTAGGTISTNGVLYYKKDFTSDLVITGSNNIFRGCRIKTAGGSFARGYNDKGTGNVLEYCTVVPNAGRSWGFSTIVEGNNAIMEHNDISFGGNLLSVYANHITFRYNYLHDAANLLDSSDHVDGIEVYDGDNHLFQFNRIDCHITHPPSQSCVSPFNIAPWGGGTCNVVEIYDNFIDGGNAHILVDGQTTGINDVKNVRVAGNDFGGHTNATFGIYATFQNADGRPVVSSLSAQASNPLAVYWANNFWAETQTAPALSPNRNGQVASA